MILGINTSQKEHELCLLDGNLILAEEIWEASHDDAELLLSRLENLLKNAKTDKNEIKQICVINGPGSYTPLRMGVAFANALAYALSAKLYATNLFDLIKLKSGKQNCLPIVFGGALNISIMQSEEVKFGSMHDVLADLPHEEFEVYAELNDVLEKELKSISFEKKWNILYKKDLKSLAKVLSENNLNKARAVDQVEEFYLRAPNISKSKNPWKQ